MKQLIIELDNETAQRLTDAAARAQMHVSDWVSALVRARICGQWPSDVRQLAGAWPDLAEATELRQSGTTDLPRDIFL